MTNAIWNIGSIAIGALITFLVTRRYYIRAALDLESETDKIRKLLGIILQSLEDSGMVELNRNTSGQIIGMNYKLSVDSLMHSQSITSPTLNEIKKD